MRTLRILVLVLGIAEQHTFATFAQTTTTSVVPANAEQEILALEEQMEAQLRANSTDRTASWAEDVVYITNHGLVLDKAALAKQVSTGQAHVESLDVSERKVRVYGDLAVVTALERMRASFHGKDPRDLVQRYTRVWARRGGRWQIVSFETTGVTDTPPPNRVGVEACAPDTTAESLPRTAAPSAETAEQMILRLEDEHSEANTPMFKGDDTKRAALGFGMLGDDYVSINASGNFGDKAAAMRRYGPGGVKILWEKYADRSARMFGATAIVTGTWCLRSVREGKESSAALRFTRVWFKKDGKWEVVSWQGTPIVSSQDPAPGSTPVASADTNRAQDEAALRKKVADGDDAWNRRDVSALLANARFTENCDHISVRGSWLSGKAQVYKVFQAPTMSIHRTIERIRFITPEVAVLVVRSTYTRDNRSWDAMSIAVHHKINGQWWAESFQNTLVQSREEAIAQAERATSPMPQTEPEVVTPAGSKIDFSGDVSTIRKRVADVVDGWNRRDSKAVTADASQNHDHVNVIGEWRQGKAEIDKAMTAALATTRNNQRGSIAKIRFITPDVAIVIVRHEYTNDKETLKSISTSVLHKMNGEWWNEAFQNTYVWPPVADVNR